MPMQPDEDWSEIDATLPEAWKGMHADRRVDDRYKRMMNAGVAVLNELDFWDMPGRHELLCDIYRAMEAERVRVVDPKDFLP